MNTNDSTRDRDSALDYFAARADDLCDLVSELAHFDTPSHDADQISRFVDCLAAHLSAAGLSCEIIADRGGPHLYARKAPLQVAEAARDRPAVVLIGHSDTVWPRGEAERRPPTVRSGHLFGPGVYDMRAGLALIVAVARYLRDAAVELSSPLDVFIGADEELGSPTAKPHMKRLCAQQSTALVLEPPTAAGDLKATRKGVGLYTLEVIGLEAHAGAEPEKGASAIHELVSHIADLSRLADPSRGITVNVGKIAGGTASNVVAGRAVCGVDFRFDHEEDGDAIDAKMRTLAARDARCRIEVRGEIIFPPLEATPRNQRAAQRALDVARRLGLVLGVGHSGGGSDGSYLSQIGLAVVDGLGVDGGGAHAQNEHIVLERLPIRAAHLAELVIALSEDPVVT